MSGFVFAFSVRTPPCRRPYEKSRSPKVTRWRWPGSTNPFKKNCYNSASLTGGTTAARALYPSTSCESSSRRT